MGCQEGAKRNGREERHFDLWPAIPQADFLEPEVYTAVYRTNAHTRHGEHGNAMLTRWPVVSHQHEDMSDHRFEQRGLLHCEVMVHGLALHVVVVHLGLIKSSRVRQLAQLVQFITREVPADAPLVVAGDFNDWGRTVQRTLSAAGLQAFNTTQAATFPSRLPVVQLDHVYARGMLPLGLQVPRGRIWGRMSDHLPLIADFDLAMDLV